MTENEARTLYVNTAKNYLGVTEGTSTHHAIIDRYNTINPLPRGYRVTYSDDWCAAFVSSIAKECGFVNIITPECSCYYMTEGFKADNRWKASSYIPKTGDIIMYDWNANGLADHVGIVVSCDGTNITTIEGNYDGGRVAHRYITTSYAYILGYCIPNYPASGASSDTSIPKQIWDFLVAKLGNEYGAAAMMGNLEAESNLCPHRLQNDFTSGYTRSVEYTAQVDSGAISRYDFTRNGPGGGGYGLAQWTYYSRKEGLYDLWKSGGYTSIGSLQLALDYLWIELGRDFPGVLSVLKTATSIRTASDKVLHDFESPADQSTSVEASRASMGQAWYDKYSGSTPGPLPGEGGGGGTGGTTFPAVPIKIKKMSLLLMVAATRRR